MMSAYETMNNYIANNASTHFILETHKRKADGMHLIACIVPLEQFDYDNIKAEKSGAIKYRRNNSTDKYYQRIAENMIDCGLLAEFNATCKAYKEMLKKSKGKENPETKQYNRGWHLERAIYKHFHKRWKRFDNTPHGQAGDFEIDGIKYQIKAHDGEF